MHCRIKIVAYYFAANKKNKEYRTLIMTIITHIAALKKVIFNKYSLYGLLSILGILFFGFCLHYVAFHVAQQISPPTPEASLNFPDKTNLIIQQGEALSAYLNLLIGLPISIILALLAIGLAFLAYRTSTQTERREIRVYKRETSKHVREQLQAIVLQIDDVLSKSRDFYHSLNTLDRATINGRWSTDFPSNPEMISEYRHYHRIKENSSFFSPISKNFPWDTEYEDKWHVNCYDLVTHNIKKIEQLEISKFSTEQAKNAQKQEKQDEIAKEPKRPAIGEGTTFQLTPRAQKGSISYEIQKAERSLIDGLCKVSSREILTQLGIFVNIEQGEDNTLYELPNSFKKACKDYFQETRKFFNQALERHYSITADVVNENTFELETVSKINEAMFAPLKEFFSHEELVLWMKGKQCLKISETDQVKLSQKHKLFLEKNIKDSSFSQSDALRVLINYWCKNVGAYIADDKRAYEFKFPNYVRNHFGGIAELLTLTDCLDCILTKKMSGDKVARIKISSDKTQLIERLSGRVEQFNQIENQHNLNKKFPLKIRMSYFRKFAYFEFEGLTDNEDIIKASSATRKWISEQLTQIYNDFAATYGVKSELNPTSFTIGVGVAGDLTIPNISRTLDKYETILNDLLSPKSIKRSFMAHPSIAMRLQVCDLALVAHPDHEVTNHEKNIMVAISKFKDLVEAISNKRVTHDQQTESNFDVLSRDRIREVLIDEVAKTSNTNYYFNRARLLNSFSELLNEKPDPISGYADAYKKINIIAEKLYRSQNFGLENEYTFLREKHSAYQNKKTSDISFEIVPKYSNFHIIALLLYCYNDEPPNSIISTLHRMTDIVEACEVIAKNFTIPKILGNKSVKDTAREICNIDATSQLDNAIFEQEYRRLSLKH